MLRLKTFNPHRGFNVVSGNHTCPIAVYNANYDVATNSAVTFYHGIKRGEAQKPGTEKSTRKFIFSQ